jgi:hypothetical protein
MANRGSPSHRQVELLAPTPTELSLDIRDIIYRISVLTALGRGLSGSSCGYGASFSRKLTDINLGMSVLSGIYRGPKRPVLIRLLVHVTRPLCTT